MIVLDTSGVVAALDRSEELHEAALGVLEKEAGPMVLSPFVLAELDYLVGVKDLDAELRLLRDVAEGAFVLETMSADDVEAAADLVERYRDLRIGLTDASIVVLADRVKTKRVLTLDERHFRALRPLSGGRFTLLPADA